MLNEEKTRELFEQFTTKITYFTGDVAIIGKGTASLLMIPSLIRSGANITIFHDSETKELGVGESTVPTVQKQLTSVNLFIYQLIKKNIASYKTGVRFFGWGDSEKFDHPFGSNDLAFHFYTRDFNKFLVEHYSKNFNCKFIDQKVDKVFEDDGGVYINGSKFDAVVHASGWSENLTTYISSPFETVNSGVTFTEYPHTAYTSTVHRATEDGWQFELPYPESNKSRCGYLFNRKFSNEESILKKFEGRVESYLKWNPRYSEKLIVSKRQALIGNALFFFEPLQAFSTHYYCVFSDMIAEYLGNIGDQKKIDSLNTRYTNLILDYLRVIAFHYKKGSKYKTPYWIDIQKRANQFCPDDITSFRFFTDFDYNIIKNGINGENFIGETLNE